MTKVQLNVPNRVADVNRFVENEDGVFQAASEARDFDYSDGAESEQLLRHILENAKDLSSDSGELQAEIVDWPTEYHLSSTRANLLRSLNLSGVKRVLELGCGCGSITRFLAEQDDIQVDAIEGSASRAALASIRCRDLENVQISAANFNDIEVPESEYDLVLFVGVTEYAGRFSNLPTDQEALNELLQMGKRAAKSDGVILIAIENRLGMKYALGACEDHYAVPFLGLENYPKSTGIRTYSRSEWLQEIDKAGFNQQTLLLPFPDYKIPTVILRQDCEATAAADALSQIRSRDYSQPFCLGDQEDYLWQTLAQAGTLSEHSNSFLWLIGNNAERIAAMSSHIAERGAVTFDTPELNYSPMGGPARGMRDEDAKVIEHLNAQITQLESHSSNLEGKVQLMSNSIGWKFLNGIRRLFRKTTL